MLKVAVKGNTFPVKDRLKALGATWDANAKVWMIESTKAQEAANIVANTPVNTPGKCSRCGRTCKSPYTMCWSCKSLQEGKCANCGDYLGEWERRKGISRCGECRDGGSRARGGQSYVDRSGNFVLGDDD